MSEMKFEAAIPPDLTIPDPDREKLKKELTAAVRGVLDKNEATKGKHVSVALDWKAKPGA
jgi:hypothetical protein